jgi:phosphatidylglycerophosphate synthase
MIKARFDTEVLSVRIGLFFAHLKISPNTWTVISIIPAILGFVALAVYQDLLWALILFILAGFIDAIDGAVARVTSRVSALGAFLDGVIDRYVEILMYLSILIYLGNTVEVFILSSSLWVALLIFGALMPTFVRAYADHKKIVTEPADLKRMGGFLERAERLILVYLGLFAGLYGAINLAYFIAFAAVLANLTAFQRIWFALKYKKAD